MYKVLRGTTEQKIIKGNIYGMEEPTGGVGEVLKKVGMLK